MKLTKEQKLALPKKASNRAQYAAFMLMGAAYEAMEEVVEVLSPRARLIPYGLRDLTLARNILRDTVSNMLHTFEPVKQAQIARSTKAMRLKTVFTPDVVKEGERIIIEVEDLALLVNAAQQECKMRLCDPGECHKCILGGVLDRVSVISRGNRAWWEVLGRAQSVDVGAEEVEV